ncbi:MAG: TetR/AcrR family transcriptional regulator [Myxococcales bacterium]|nr:MAG: TetR/AcrR family transcriptional regulator [Myxococcales bacterium]
MNKLQSTMATARKAYHHGDLRESLLEAAETMLEEEGPTGLSLRKLGRELGVTPGAPYRHFEDKDALLAALAIEGYRRLRAELVRDLGSVDDAEQRLKLAGTGYLRFATSHPELFRLMFGWMPSRDIPELCEAGDAAFAAFDRILQDCADEGLLSRGVREAGLLAWSAVHGAAFLLIDERLELDDPKPSAECILDLMHDSIWSGIGRR